MYCYSKEGLKDENEHLKACIRQLENKITSLTGQTALPSNGTSPLKLRTISLEGEKYLDEQDPWILVGSQNNRKIRKTEVQRRGSGKESESDPQEIRAINTQTKKGNKATTENKQKMK